jgi:hypothetical protein
MEQDKIGKRNRRRSLEVKYSNHHQSIQFWMLFLLETKIGKDIV